MIGNPPKFVWGVKQHSPFPTLQEGFFFVFWEMSQKVFIEKCLSIQSIEVITPLTFAWDKPGIPFLARKGKLFYGRWQKRFLVNNVYMGQKYLSSPTLQREKIAVGIK